MTAKDIKTIQEGFEQDKRDYWTIREELLPKLKGKWVAVHKGNVVAVGDDMISIMDKALSEDGYAYVNKLGEEDKIIIKSRRIEFAYDQSYSPTPIPIVTATFYNFDQSRSKRCSNAIPDTGADLSCLPIVDCHPIDLFRFPYYSGISYAFGGGTRQTTFYGGNVEIDGRVYRAIIEPVLELERLIGRDVLNQCKVTFDGPGGITSFAED
ncbi:hypothetical protein FJZ31_17135 [Candidatus Poribacteria bacterium]|nr:hypothetical protein [Candidatus Poribacteria bacterium]